MVFHSNKIKCLFFFAFNFHWEFWHDTVMDVSKSWLCIEESVRNELKWKGLDYHLNSYMWIWLELFGQNWFKDVHLTIMHLKIA